MRECERANKMRERDNERGKEDESERVNEREKKIMRE
jgi:hypothetical protein